jgi:uncharacterized protein (TIGR02453 family)
MFTAKTLSFLRSLKRNNKREWFHAHKDQYELHCRQPMLELVERIAPDLKSIAPHHVADPKVSMFRQFRDTRFSDDKTPMKTHIAATFPNRTLGRLNGAGIYFEIAPGWVWIGGGLWRPDSSQLQLVREHIVAHQRQFESIIKAPRLKKIGGLKGDRLTRVPRGFAKDHPAADYLQHRQFLAFREEPSAFATSKDFYKQLVWTIESFAPLVQFLNEPLVAPLAGDRHAKAFDARLRSAARGEEEEYSSTR